MWVTVVLDVGEFGQRVFPELIVGVISTLTALALLSAAGRLVGLFSIAWQRNLGVIVAYLATGLVRNLTLAFVSIPLHLALPTNRLLPALFGGFAILIFANLTADRRMQSRHLQESLMVERQKLIWLSATYDEKVLQAKRDLERELEADLYPSIREIDAKLNEGIADNSKTAEFLIATVADVVRPTWNRLTEATDNLMEQLDSIVADASSNLPQSQKFSIKSAIRPTLVVGVLLLISLTVAPALGSHANWIGFLHSSLVVWILLVVVKLIWSAKGGRLGMGASTLILWLLYATAFAVGLTISNGTEGDFAAQTVRYTFTIGGALVLARLELVEQARRLFEHQLTEQNHQLEQLVSGLRKQVWVYRRNAAWVLHGPVQSALMAAAMAVTQPGLQQHQRSELFKHIEDAVNSLSLGSRENPGLVTALEDIKGVWARSCNVQFENPDELEQLLAQDPETIFCLVEIAREGVSNAIRHGGAKNVKIEMKSVGGTVIEICVTDDGSGLSDNGAGLGSAMLDQVALRWQREPQVQGVRLCAQVVTSR